MVMQCSQTTATMGDYGARYLSSPVYRCHARRSNSEKQLFIFSGLSLSRRSNSDLKQQPTFFFQISFSGLFSYPVNESRKTQTPKTQTPLSLFHGHAVLIDNSHNGAIFLFWFIAVASVKHLTVI